MPSLAMLWLGLCFGLLAGANARSTPSHAVRAPIILVPVRISCTMGVCIPALCMFISALDCLSET